MTAMETEKRTRVFEEEVILINGVPVNLSGEEGNELKRSLLAGIVPPKLLESVLGVHVGGGKFVTKVDASLTVKHTTTHKDTTMIQRNGVLVEEKCVHRTEEKMTKTEETQTWSPEGMPKIPVEDSIPEPWKTFVDPVKMSHRQNEERRTSSSSSAPSSKHSSTYSSSSSFASPNTTQESKTCSSDGEYVHLKLLKPTIFGTVTSDQDPTEHGSRKTFPQTPRSQQGITNNGLFVDRTPYMEESIRDRSDHALVYRHNNLVSGPIEALVQHLVPTEEYYPEHTYLFAFLLTSRLFIKPHELLGQVFELCALHRDFNELHISRGPHSKLGPNIIQLLGEWTETFPYDFRDERMKNHLKSLTQFCLRLDPHLDKEVSQLLQKLLHTLENLEKHEELLRRMQPGVRMINQQVTNEIMSVCPDPVILAQQLTRIELERLSFIGPEEFVQTFAKESQTLETSFKDIKQTKNLESYISWFNHLSYFVATEVIIQLKKKHRVRVIEFFIEVARECFNIGNFNSLMAIISGLNLSPITRLKKTWHRVATRKLHILEQQMAPNSNFTSYRATLAAAMWRSQGAQDDRRRIIVPLFSLLVKDLYFLNEGCANRLPNGHVNFEKFWQLAKQVSEFITWQRVSCPFELDEAINKYLNTNPIFKDDAVLTMASFECEAPENTLEKERQKVLNKKFGKENWALNTTMKNYKKENRT